MKKYYVIIAILFVMTVFVLPVSASATAKAGVKPGSFFYFFDKAFERADLFFTFSPENKAKKALEYAEERLAEAEESASENKPEAVAEAMENYQENIEVLEKVLNKIPDDAKEAIEKAIEASKKGKEEKEEVIEKANELEKGISEIKKETEEANNEIKEEETGKNDEQKKEIEKLEQNKESQPRKINQSSEIERLQKEIEDLKKKVEKQSNTSSSLDLSPINITPSNVIVCNGKNWTTCPSGQKFYCPDTGDAQCLYENIQESNSITENPYLKIEKCKAQRDQSRANLETTAQEMVDALTSNYAKLLLTSFEQYKGTLMASDFNGLIAEYRRKRTLDVKDKYDQMANDEYSKCINN